MGVSSFSPSQDFSDWDLLRLEKYRKDLACFSDRRDRRTIHQVDNIITGRYNRYAELYPEFRRLIDDGTLYPQMEQQDQQILDEYSNLLDQVAHVQSKTAFISSLRALRLRLIQSGMFDEYIGVIDDIAPEKREKFNIDGFITTLKALYEPEIEDYIEIPDWLRPYIFDTCDSHN